MGWGGAGAEHGGLACATAAANPLHGTKHRPTCHNHALASAAGSLARQPARLAAAGRGQLAGRRAPGAPARTHAHPEDTRFRINVCIPCRALCVGRRVCGVVVCADQAGHLPPALRQEGARGDAGAADDQARGMSRGRMRPWPTRTLYPVPDREAGWQWRGGRCTGGAWCAGGGGQAATCQQGSAAQPQRVPTGRSITC